MYIVALPKWAHLPLKSKWLPRYEVAKSATMRVFSTFCMGKYAKKSKFSFLKTPENGNNFMSKNQFLGPKLGPDLGNRFPLIHQTNS